MNVLDYIKQHNHINYCEALIYPDGTIEDARPSHTEALIRATHENRDIICEKMPISASPAQWLVDYTGCVAVWYDFAYLPESLNDSQIQTIMELVEAKILSNCFVGYMDKELSIIKRNQIFSETGEFYDIDKRIIPFCNNKYISQKEIM